MLMSIIVAFIKCLLMIKLYLIYVPSLMITKPVVGAWPSPPISTNRVFHNRKPTVFIFKVFTISVAKIKTVSVEGKIKNTK